MQDCIDKDDWESKDIFLIVDMRDPLDRDPSHVAPTAGRRWISSSSAKDYFFWQWSTNRTGSQMAISRADY